MEPLIKATIFAVIGVTALSAIGRTDGIAEGVACAVAGYALTSAIIYLFHSISNPR